MYLRDIATIQDYVDITYGYALVNGKNSVYLPIIKKDTGSTLTVVADVHKSMQLFRDAVPKDVTINFEFDESPTVVAAVESVATEGMIGAGLTGLMILLFLGDLRSVLVVVLNIPLALLGSLVGLWLTGNTINIMSLGGMALAIGILVDEATVTIENTHVQMEHAPMSPGRCSRRATPRRCRGCWLALHSVGVHSGVHHARPAAVAVHATDPGGRVCHDHVVLLSSMFVPIMSVTLLKQHGSHGEKKAGLFDRFLKVYGTAVSWFVRLRWLTVPIYLGGMSVILAVVGMQVGTELFPQIDSGEFVLRFRPPPGSNFELTRQVAIKCLEEIEREAARAHEDHDGLRRAGRPQLWHRQHGIVHAGARRRTVAGRAHRRQWDQARRVSREVAQGSA